MMMVDNMQAFTHMDVFTYNGLAMDYHAVIWIEPCIAIGAFQQVDMFELLKADPPQHQK